MTALSEILTWSESAPAWLRDALRCIVTSAELTDADLVALAELCKLPHGLSTSEAKPDPLSPKHIPAPSDAGTVVLSSINRLSGPRQRAVSATWTA